MSWLRFQLGSQQCTASVFEAWFQNPSNCSCCQTTSTQHPSKCVDHYSENLRNTTSKIKSTCSAKCPPLGNDHRDMPPCRTSKSATIRFTSVCHIVCCVVFNFVGCVFCLQTPCLCQVQVKAPHTPAKSRTAALDTARIQGFLAVPDAMRKLLHGRDVLGEWPNLKTARTIQTILINKKATIPKKRHWA